MRARAAIGALLVACGGGAAGTDGGAPPDGSTGDDVSLPQDGAAPADAGSSTCMGAVPLAYQAATDRDPHQVAPPALGPAGTVVQDPTYGTSILRLTDQTTGASTTSYRVANEFWGNDWSTDSKLFYLQASTSAFLPYAFDPKAFTAARVQDDAKPGNPLAMPLAPGGFSRTEPTIFYGMSGLTIESYDFATQTKSTVVALPSIVAGATGYALGVEQGANGLLVSAFGGPQQDKMPYVVTYDPATQTSHVVDVTQSTLDGKPIGLTIGGGVHTFKIDASGRWVVFSVITTKTVFYLWDTQTQTIVAGANGALGWGELESSASADSYDWSVQAIGADASTPLVAPLLTPTDKLASASASWSNAAGGPGAPLIVETMRQPSDTGPWRAWDDEIVALRTDGVTSEVWRFAHNFNAYTGTIYSDNFYYLFIPRVSQNGWFVLFDSNWNGTLGTDASGNPRTDAFIVALPNDCGP